jgi:competence protein ComEA
MDALPRSHVAAGLVLLALGGLLAMRLADRQAAPAAAAPQPVRVERAGVGGSKVVVHVAGAVRRPGVYRMRAGERVDDAVRRAGGATRRADLSAVNLAAEVEDGRQIVVPRRPVAAAGAGSAGAVAAGGADAGGAPAPAAPSSGPLNLNQATLEQLDELDGVGPATAQKIIEWRTQHGGFTSVDELDAISGIGEKRLASLRTQVTV